MPKLATLVLLAGLSACSSQVSSHGNSSDIPDESRAPEPCIVQGVLPDGTEIRSFSFDLVPSERGRMAVKIDYTDPKSDVLNHTAALRAGDHFPASGTYVIESIDPVPEAFGNPETGMAAILVQQATVRHREGGAKFLLRWDGRHCQFKKAS